MVLNTGAFFSLPTSSLSLSLYIFVYANEGFLCLPAIMELLDNNPAKQTELQKPTNQLSLLLFFQSHCNYCTQNIKNRRRRRSCVQRVFTETKTGVTRHKSCKIIRFDFIFFCFYRVTPPTHTHSPPFTLTRLSFGSNLPIIPMEGAARIDRQTTRRALKKMTARQITFLAFCPQIRPKT